MGGRAKPGNRADPASTAVSDLMAGQQAYVSGNIDASVQQLQAAVDANPNDPRALSDLGQVLVRTGRAREAVTYLDKAASLKPDSWAYQFNRARDRKSTRLNSSHLGISYA